MTKTEFYKYRKKANLTQKQAGFVVSKTERHIQNYEAVPTLKIRMRSR